LAPYLSYIIELTLDCESPGVLRARRFDRIVDCKRNRDVLSQYLWRQGNEEQALGVSREQAAENRRAIVAAATRLFRERGVEAVGLNELMKHAGFTQGGFYNHFESKADLVAEVLASAITEGNAGLAKMARAPVKESTTALCRYINWYLSQSHRDDIDHGCPVTGFAGDAPRLGAGAQSHFANGLDDQITILAGLIAESGPLPAVGEGRTLRERAISLHCKMLGALVLSRSVAQAAPAFSNEILENARRDVLASLDEAPSHAPKPRKQR
jgi:TetR/AcrR family transcriptional regulator, transcriptional repressor for nem operon